MLVPVVVSVPLLSVVFAARLDVLIPPMSLVRVVLFTVTPLGTTVLPDAGAASWASTA